MRTYNRLFTKAQLARFMKHVQFDTNGCWYWLAFKEGNGYPRFSGFYEASGEQYAHRLAYINWIAPIPDDKEIDHLCRNRSCVNPFHLEVVTRKVNMERSARGMQTHCKKGHALSGENMRYEATSAGLKSRRCKTCKDAYDREYRKRA